MFLCTCIIFSEIQTKNKHAFFPYFIFKILFEKRLKKYLFRIFVKTIGIFVCLLKIISNVASDEKKSFNICI